MYSVMHGCCVREGLSGCQFPDTSTGFPEVNGVELPILNHNPAMDDHCADTAAGLTVGQKPGTVEGLKMRSAEVKEDEVSGGAGRQGAVSAWQS